MVVPRFQVKFEVYLDDILAASAEEHAEIPQAQAPPHQQEVVLQENVPESANVEATCQDPDSMSHRSSW